jgi:hypothetical protein
MTTILRERQQRILKTRVYDMLKATEFYNPVATRHQSESLEQDPKSEQ